MKNLKLKSEEIAAKITDSVMIEAAAAVEALKLAESQNEEIKVLRTSLISTLTGKKVALDQEKSFVGAIMPVTGRLKKRRDLEREIAELEISISEINDEFLSAAEKSITEAQDKIAAILYPTILNFKKIEQVSLNESFVVGNLIISAFQAAVDLVRQNPIFAGTGKDLFIDLDFDTSRAPKSDPDKFAEIYMFANAMNAALRK